MQKIANSPLLGVVDLFCGMGGTSYGVEMTELRKRKMAEVIACVNHDKNAINSHYLNLPHVKHFTEDIRTLDLRKLKAVVQLFRLKHPSAKIVLWASLECTNFSKAKGGLSRKADSRTLAEHLFRYLEALNPDYVMIENVVEFLDWGPLRVKSTGENKRVCQLAVDKQGELVYIPVKEKKGTYFKPWKEAMCNYGYTYSQHIMMAADYGIRQTRKRLFIQFAKHGLPFAWPEPTHDKTGRHGLPKWLPVRPLLELHDKGDSLFKVSKQKNGNDKLRFASPNSRKRILEGCIKFIGNGDRAFLTKKFTSHSGKQLNKGVSVDEPAPTIMCSRNSDIVQPEFLSKFNGEFPGSRNTSLDNPAGTITTNGSQAIAQAEFLTAFYSNGGEVQTVHRPSPTIPTKDRLALAQPQQAWLDKNRTGEKWQCADINEPAPTIMASVNQAVVQPEQFIHRSFSGGGTAQSVDAPAGTVLATPKLDLVSTEQFIWNTASIRKTYSSLDDAAPTVTSSRHYPYLLDMQFKNSAYSADKPSPTIIAHQDKKPLYLIVCEFSDAPDFGIAVYDNDDAVTIDLKKFMAYYRIYDIKIRMLNERELLRIQDFPDDYKMVGTQAEKKKFIGNAVPPGMATKIIGATAHALLNVTVEQFDLLKAV